jgi:hypothetical protein
MKISDLLAPIDVVIDVRTSSKRLLLQELAIHLNSIRRSPDGRRLLEPSPFTKIIFPQQENNHGTKIFEEGIRQGRARDEEAQGRDLEERTVWQEGQEPQTGDRDWAVRGAGGRQEGPQEGFEEGFQESFQESLEEKEDGEENRQET